MMKKVLLISALFLFGSFFIPRAASAQGEFYCEWFGQECTVAQVPMNAQYGCEAGFEPNFPLCTSINNPNECNSSHFECVSKYEEECYECDTQTNKCFPTQPDKYGGNCPFTNKSLCTQECIKSAPEPKKESSNLKCGGGNGINTAIGCIPIANTNQFIGFILRWAIGVGGGIAFLLILVAGFQIMTSTGDPKRLQAGKELLTSAIAGLIMLIFSVFILRIIGVDILKLPGLQ